MALHRGSARPDDRAMSAEPLTLLRDTWFTADMPPAIVSRLAELGEVRDFAANAPIISSGAPCAALGLLLDGCVALRIRVPGDPSRTILTLEGGDIVGWSAILPPPSVATATAVAIVPTRVMLFERGRLAAAMSADCTLAEAVTRRVLQAVARRLQATRLQLLDVYRPEREPW